MKKLLLALLLCAAPIWAALPSTIVFEVNQGGNNANAGCFNTGSSGSDNTYPTPTVITYTDLVIDATTNTKVTSAGNPFTSSSPGRCLRISSGTGFTTGLYYIVSQAAGVATLDRAVGTTSSTGGNGKSGGALATISQLVTDFCSGCSSYVKADATYTITAKININFSNNSLTSFIEGYTSTRGDNGKPTIQATSGFGDRMFDFNLGGTFSFRNFILDVNSQSGVTAILTFNAQKLENIEVKGFVATGFGAITFFGNGTICRNCYIHDGAAGSSSVVIFSANNINTCMYCTIRNVSGATAIAFEMRSGTCLYCIVDTMSGATSDAFQTAILSNLDLIDHCVVYNVTRDAIRVSSIAAPVQITNCIFSTAVNGINNTSGTTLRAGDFYNDSNFSYNLSGAAVVNLTAGPKSASLSVDPFTSASGHDFSINATANGGALIRAAGVPASIAGTTSTGYPDGGAFQHQDSGGGGAVVGGFVAP